MFADMVEYSKRLEEDEAGNSVQAARAIELFKALVGDYGGQVVNVSGDGILALFDSADRALQFAVQIQAEFRDQSVWGDGEPIQFRIGLNLGEVAVHGGNVLGHCVNVAARIQALGEPNCILLTAGMRSAVGEVSGVSLRSLGPQKLKNISELTEVFSVERSDAPAAPPPAEARPPPQLELAPVGAPTIAVLALSNLSGDPRNDHLCEGISEDIIASLTRFRSLMVIARHSAFLFDLKATPAQEVQRRLGVRYILSGSLRRADKRLRIAVELIDAASESVLWSDRFNVEVEDLFDLQDEIAGAVAARLSACTAGSTAKRSPSTRTQSRSIRTTAILSPNMPTRWSTSARARSRSSCWKRPCGSIRTIPTCISGISPPLTIPWGAIPTWLRRSSGCRIPPRDSGFSP